ncbi:MAG TPA: DUF6498-containing protein [Spirochaetota bacterium]|nr:DUF6498-containing protein [Spirochaetota bacterium]HPJ36057.1 DUF6498-containing protein [Spirochaetota bacterium]
MLSGMMKILYPISSQLKNLFITSDGRRSAFAVIINNSLITAGFIFLNWELSAVVLVFWVEGIVAGLFGAVKLLMRSVYELEAPDEGPVFKSFMISIIFVAYLALMSLMIFITALFLPLFINAMSDKPVIIYENGSDLSGYMTALAFYLKTEFFPFSPDLSSSSFLQDLVRSKFLLLINLTAVHAYLFLHNFIKRRFYLSASLNKLIIRPTGRFFMIYLVLGVFILPFAGLADQAGLLFPVIVWMVCKTFYDLYGGYIDILADE